MKPGGNPSWQVEGRKWLPIEMTRIKNYENTTGVSGIMRKRKNELVRLSAAMRISNK